MFDEQNRFVIKNYGEKPEFSSFLPGLAGTFGIPVWCFYNNRGQGVCSFGVDDKDHAIMEFSPAHVAYRDNSRMGFRTFVRAEGIFKELFTKNCDMHIGMSEMEICCEEEHLSAKAVYFGIPGERAGMLGRILTITNIAEGNIELECLDGMPAIVPYGISQESLKNMTQLAKAWMQVEDVSEGRPYYRARASMEDTARVTAVKEGNFSAAFTEEGKVSHPIVEPGVLFGMDSSFSVPDCFRKKGLSAVCEDVQMMNNIFPCCFWPAGERLLPGESLILCTVYGQCEDKRRRDRIIDGITGIDWFLKKREEAAALTHALTDKIAVKTADPVFDAYCRQTFLDNILRGGTPMFFSWKGQEAPFYLYSRKHGDPEREYNYFSLGREYFSQGNGNFRDVCQNRRCDVLYEPRLRDGSISAFYELIQADGYNPLVIKAAVYKLDEKERRELCERMPHMEKLFSGAFTPGAVAMAAEDSGMSKQEALELTSEVICRAKVQPSAEFKEGYWCDHWTYNLDLVESYLSVYPEHKMSLLFKERKYRWYDSGVRVLPRSRRYVSTPEGLRQYGSLDESGGRKQHCWLTTEDGQEACSSLMEKMLLLCAVKTAALDFEGMGIEMEGGKPGWYDALNGLPGLFGSSMAETCELKRLLDFVRGAFAESGADVEMYQEIYDLLKQIAGILEQETDSFSCWDKLNYCKEAYREKIYGGFSGKRRRVSAEEAVSLLEVLSGKVQAGIEKARRRGNGICPTYFTFQAEDGESEGNMPKRMNVKALPLFLEGPVHWMKLGYSRKEKAAMAERVRESGLYDRRLKMYKVNDSLKGVSFEAGRALAFTPGWLENESVWLHMEYKYLLELLKNGLYDCFAKDFYNAAVPFLDPSVYGRSTLENVSFIASGANPDKRMWGRGFVARLSGSTAEFLQMWQIMFFGADPFRQTETGIQLSFQPFIPDYLMPEDGCVTAMFLGHIPVTYHAPGIRALIPGRYQVSGCRMIFHDGHSEEERGSEISRQALAVRDGQVASIDVFIGN